jgi:hypothetical protein
MARFRVHAYDSDHHATLIIESDGRERAEVVATEFVAAMLLGYYPADHEQRWPELVRIEIATSWLERTRHSRRSSRAVEAVDPDPPDEA